MQKIINISSLNSIKDDINPYTLSKKGVNDLTKGFAKEYAVNNIIVNAFAPGNGVSSINYQNVYENTFDSSNRIKKINTSEEIVELAVFYVVMQQTDLLDKLFRVMVVL